MTDLDLRRSTDDFAANCIANKSIHDDTIRQLKTETDVVEVGPPRTRSQAPRLLGSDGLQRLFSNSGV
jgi:hypothetical protein